MNGALYTVLLLSLHLRRQHSSHDNRLFAVLKWPCYVGTGGVVWWKGEAVMY